MGNAPCWECFCLEVSWSPLEGGQTPHTHLYPTQAPNIPNIPIPSGGIGFYTVCPISRNSHMELNSKLKAWMPLAVNVAKSVPPKASQKPSPPFPGCSLGSIGKWMGNGKFPLEKIDSPREGLGSHPVGDVDRQGLEVGVALCAPSHLTG